ncbi:hypothetical protein ABZ642_28855 [Streptomyces sp. NPDC007157]|uniref:hypothetical protein n=1 Tax=Streptomyces sp. NPDC007157 TaxID=3154681 RepID=UPI0033DB22B2
MSSISRGSSGLSFTRRRAGAGSRFTPASTRVPPVAASSAFDSPSSARIGRRFHNHALDLLEEATDTDA